MNINNKALMLGIAVAIVGVGVVVLAMKPKSNTDAVTLDGTAVQARLGSVGNLYAMYLESRGTSPATLEDLVVFGRKLKDPIIFNEEFLTLPRDKQRMVIRFSLKLPAPRPRNASDGDGPIFSTYDGPILAHEQTGIHGRRFVVFAGSNRVTEVDDVTFQKNLQP